MLQTTKKQHNAPNYPAAPLILQRNMQLDACPKGMESIRKLDQKQRLDLLAKTPFLDQKDGLIKVGGRLTHADLAFCRKRPILIPDTLTGDAPLGYLHSKTEHQGRKITTSSIRENGFWPVGGRGRITRLSATCVPCRKLRGPVMTQKITHLPEQRLYRTPPFYHCGIDVFGHFLIQHSKATREFKRSGNVRFNEYRIFQVSV